jgi:predicted outer membrane repeat protein
MSRWFRRSAGRTLACRPVSPRARLLLRALEDRLLQATFTVTNSGAAGTGSGAGGDLRYCITQASLDAGASPSDVIQFSNTTSGGTQTNFYDGTVHTITIASALPTIAGTAIVGPGASVPTVTRSAAVVATFTASGALSGMTVDGDAVGGYGISASGTLTLSGMVIQDNNSIGNGRGGGIYYVGASLAVISSVIQNNIGGNSGGIYNAGPGSIIVISSTIANDSGGDGGGIWTGGGLTVTDSTVSGNTSRARGGGVYAGTCAITNSTIANNRAATGGGLNLGGTVTLANDTITGNTATDANAVPGFGGGGIAFNPGNGLGTQIISATIVLENTIVSGNTAANGFSEISTGTTVSPAPLSTLTVSAKFSAIGSPNGFTLTDLGHNLIGANLLLGPLRGNAGNIQTVALLAGSAASGTGDPAEAGTADERGVARPQGTGVDIGACERVANTIGASAAVANISALNAPATYQFTVTYADDVPINVGSIAASNVSIAAPTGVTAPFVSLTGINSGNPNKVVATYQFTAPGGGWTAADNGLYTVNMVAGQVADAIETVSSGPLATFVAAVPAVFTVTNTGDTTGPGSLRAAMIAANAILPAPALIQFSNNTAGGATNFYDATTHAIILTSALPTIVNNLAITRPGSTLLTISPTNGGTFQLMPISAANPSGATAVSLNGLTLSGAQTTTAGAAISDTLAALTLTDVTIENNSSASRDGGIDFVSGETKGFSRRFLGPVGEFSDH